MMITYRDKHKKETLYKLAFFNKPSSKFSPFKTKLQPFYKEGGWCKDNLCDRAYFFVEFICICTISMIKLIVVGKKKREIIFGAQYSIFFLPSPFCAHSGLVQEMIRKSRVRLLWKASVAAIASPIGGTRWRQFGWHGLWHAITHRIESFLAILIN